MRIERETRPRPGRAAGRARVRRARRRVVARERAGVVGAARSHLRRYRQATLLAVAATGLLLMLVGAGRTAAAPALPGATADSLARLPGAIGVVQGAARDTAPADTTPAQAAEQATSTLVGIWKQAGRLLPRLGIALLVLLVAGLLVRLVRPLLRRLLSSWTRADGVAALFGVAVWLLAVGIALTILTGDILALAGSVGLVGLALSWALQTPIESFTAWLLNSFRGYYRVGDRIALADIRGDVYRIDVLTTTVWEFGGGTGADGTAADVRGEQPTGRLVTFPNNVLLTGAVVNSTRDFPYLWDEVYLTFSTDSDIPYLLELMRRCADEVLAEPMAGPARDYGALLRSQRLESDVPERPSVFLSVDDDGYLEVAVRYLVHARERRKWKSRLTERILEELRRPEAVRRIVPAAERQLVQLLDDGPAGSPAGAGGAMESPPPSGPGGA